MCELSIKVMTTLAGFLPLDPSDKYYVPRAALGLPGDLSPQELATILFPKIETWKNELASDTGDKTKGARTFIHSVLPYLSEVIAQDGVLWAKHHAQNPAFIEVQNQLDGQTGSQNYAAWCQQKYRELKEDAERSAFKRAGTDELNAKLAQKLQDLDRIYKKLERQTEMMVSCFFLCMMKNINATMVLPFTLTQDTHLAQLRHCGSIASTHVGNGGREGTVENCSMSGRGEIVGGNFMSHGAPGAAARVLMPPMGTTNTTGGENNVGSNNVGPNLQNARLPFTAIQRPCTAPKLPTVWTLQKYKTCVRLASYRKEHMHDVVMGLPKGLKKQWNDKNDANRWSLVTKIYDRMKAIMIREGWTDTRDDSWHKAAQWLDDFEVKGSLNVYVKSLRNENGKKRRSKNNK